MGDGNRLKVYEPPSSQPDPLFRALAGAIPWVGSAIGEALTVKYSEARERRLSEAFDVLGRMVHDLGEDKLDKQYIESEEFQQLLVTCLEHVQRESREEKRRAFMNIIANAMARRLFTQRTRAEWYAGVLSRQSYLHLVALQAIVSTDEERELILRNFIDPGDREALLGCTKDLTGAGFVTDEFSFGVDRIEPKELSFVFSKISLTANGTEYLRWLSQPQDSLA